MSDDVLREIHPSLRDERGMPCGPEREPLCSIWRRGQVGDSPTYRCGMSVGEFLSDPQNQSGTWLIDGGWGGPPGPIHVRWHESGYWENGGYCGRRFAGRGT